MNTRDAGEPVDPVCHPEGRPHGRSGHRRPERYPSSMATSFPWTSGTPVPYLAPTPLGVVPMDVRDAAGVNLPGNVNGGFPTDVRDAVLTEGAPLRECRAHPPVASREPRSFLPSLDDCSLRDSRDGSRIDR